MESAKRLYAMGCGDEMVLCQIERGKIQACLYNTRLWLKHNKYALKSGLYTKEVFDNKMEELNTEMKKVAPLAAKFHALYGEDYNKLLNSIQKATV